MGESSLPDTLLTRLDELERQMRDLNQSAQTQYSSIKDGSLRILNEAGETVIDIGKTSDTNFGIIIYSPEGRQIFSAGRGVSAAPPGIVPLVVGGSAVVSGTSFRPGTTSASFTVIWTGTLFSIGPDVFWTVNIFPNSGNMDFRVRILEQGGGTATNVYLDTAITANGNRNGTFAIPTACLVPATGTDPLGRFYTLTFEAKRNSGASPVDIQPTSMPLNANFI